MKAAVLLSERDGVILALWNAGHNAEQIAAEVGLPEARIFHELNRILLVECSRRVPLRLE